ncbi:MAG: hypothetical protein A3H42_05980 [Deltaproteobacteria bacterium RIFCSPLOWO2_02_FULL_46_8]|nr:MAG: hypothetical protein A3H42_05980 [Deltaproteobacteria bacterium RIFCSPLOWO2_02_FULL_46_8]
MKTAKLSQKNQIVVPKEVRKRLKLSAGMNVSIYPIDDYSAVIVRHPTDYVQALKGLGKDLWDRLGGVEYIKRERKSWDKKNVWAKK